MDKLLVVENISKSFDNQLILSNANLSVKKGSCIGIIGPSGSGKTTLLQILGCLEYPDNGQILINNELVKKDDLIKHRRKTFGFIFQQFHLLKDYSVLNNVLLPVLISEKSIPEARKNYALILLEKVGLKDKTNQSVNLLSGGEKQRVAIARALINSPEIILADEPTGNLDSNTKKEILSLLLQLVKDEKKTLIMVTHDSDFIDSFDVVYTLRNKSIFSV